METEYKGYHIWSEFIGEKTAPFDNYTIDSADRHHKIHIEKGNQHISFDFWTSKARPEIETEDELLWAVDCFFTDAIAGENDFEDFCAEMGYEVPVGIIQSWKCCQKANTEVSKMFGEDWQDFAEEMREDLDDR